MQALPQYQYPPMLPSYQYPPMLPSYEQLQFNWNCQTPASYRATIDAINKSVQLANILSPVNAVQLPAAVPQADHGQNPRPQNNYIFIQNYATAHKVEVV